MKMNWIVWKNDILMVLSVLVSLGSWAAQSDHAAIVSAFLPADKASTILNTITTLSALAAIIIARLTDSPKQAQNQSDVK